MGTKRSPHAFVRIGTVVAMAALAAVAGAGFASAHVTAQPDTAEKGSYSKITFRVPNEDAQAGTVKLEVTLPLDHPIASVSTKPVPGWTVQATKAKLPAPIQSGEGEQITEAVQKLSWTADPGVRVGPGQFQEFDVSAGPLPGNTEQLVFPATQTYDNGKVVKWDAPPPPPGTQEPEHPAPAVKLVAMSSGQPGGGHHGTTTAPGATSEDRSARWLGGIGVVLGALGLGVGLGALVLGRRSSGRP